MSSALAIAAVSAVLRNLLDDGMVDVAPAVGSVKVTAVAPDTIKLDDPDAGPSLNLFLYRVTPNNGWSNAAWPAFGPDGGRAGNPPLALDLHFLLTAYGAGDFQAEILLGYAMLLLHERPVLDRATIRRALNPSPLGASILPPAFQALAAADLADQMESVKITMAALDTEEMSRLWSAIQAHYRPTAAYHASVVLMASERPARAALPVLSRGAVDPASGREPGVHVHSGTGPPLPALFEARPAGDQVAARLGTTVRLSGAHLAGSGVAVDFRHPLLDAPNTVLVGAHDDPAALDVVLPAGPAAEAAWPAGIWTVSVRLTRPGEAVPRTTNAVGLVLAPEPVLAPAPAVTRDGGTGRVTVVLAVRPQVRTGQRAELAVGAQRAAADPHPATTATLTFRFGALPAGSAPVRLSVDGAESLLVDRSTVPPSYDPAQRLVVPA
jgi:hypothetical protein